MNRGPEKAPGQLSCTGPGRSPGGRHGNPRQYPCLENSMDMLGCGHPRDHPCVPADPGHLVLSPFMRPLHGAAASCVSQQTHTLLKGAGEFSCLWVEGRLPQVTAACGRGQGAKAPREKEVNCFLLYKASLPCAINIMPVHVPSSPCPCLLITTTNTKLVLTRAGTVLSHFMHNNSLHPHNHPVRQIIVIIPAVIEKETEPSGI